MITWSKLNYHCLIVINLFCLSGCDVFFIKRIDLERPYELSQIKLYEANRDKLITTIYYFAVNNGMSCQPEPELLLSCENKPRSLVAFENKSGFVVCLFGLGTSWEEDKFNHLAKTLEESLISTLPNIKLKISTPHEMPDCLVPK